MTAKWKKARPRLFDPVWEGPTKKWAIGFILTNRWRCDPIHELDDLLQDAYLIFQKIYEKYPAVESQEDFMKLFRTALRNKICDRARYMMHKAPHVGEAEAFYDPVSDLTHNGYLNVLLSQAPPELRMALDMIENYPEKWRDLPRTKYRENLNMKLRRILNLGKDFDFTGTLKVLLS